MGEISLRQDCFMKYRNRENRIYGIIAFLLAFAVIVTAIIQPFSVPAFATEAEDELEEVKEQQEEAENERADVEAKLVEQQAEVERLNVLVEEKQEELDEKQLEIDDMIADITEQRNSIDDRQEGLSSRLRNMFKKGSVGFLDVLLKSASFTELLSNLSMMQIILQHDQDTLASLEDEYANLKAAMAKLGEAKASMEVAQEELETEKNNAEQAEAELAETLEYLQARIAELEAEAAEIEEVIKEEQRKAAEARAAGGYVYTGGSGTYIWPASGPITSYFGYRELYNVNGVSVSPYHGGIDIGIPTGTPVYAAAEGVVSSATGWRGDYGYGVFINHPNGTTTAYAHNSSIVVSPGEYVEQGQLIAYSGSTGWSLGPHLHFEIFVNGVRVDPMLYL